MKYTYREISDGKELFDYYNSIKADIPYWFDADYEIWHQSMFDDTDCESANIFRQLITYCAYADDKLTGFIQFGIPSYIYTPNGEKDSVTKAGVIRNLYFGSEHSQCGKELIKIADSCFEENGVQSRHAFFHALGMTCNAGHGKLYCSMPHIEKALMEWGFVKEHENVYYKRILSEADAAESAAEIHFGEVNPKGVQSFSAYESGELIGAGELVYLPQGDIAYLKWIYVEEAFRGKGYGSAMLRGLFARLYEKGIRRFDTDTADSNLPAQKLYLKTGFEDMGRTRSYHISLLTGQSGA